MQLFALTLPSIGSTTTRSVGSAPNRRSPSSSDTSTKSTPSRWSASRRATIASSAAKSMATVSSPPFPRPTGRERASRVGSSSSSKRMSAAASRQRPSQSTVTASADPSFVERREQESARQLRVEVRRLLRHRLPEPGDRLHLGHGRRPHEERAAGTSAGDGLLGLGGGGGERDVAKRQPIHGRDVQ